MVVYAWAGLTQTQPTYPRHTERIREPNLCYQHKFSSSIEREERRQADDPKGSKLRGPNARNSHACGGEKKHARPQSSPMVLQNNVKSEKTGRTTRGHLQRRDLRGAERVRCDLTCEIHTRIYSTRQVGFIMTYFCVPFAHRAQGVGFALSCSW